ncbi:hypothetical protein SEA_ZOOMAN_297 [Microbacterium phage Zooman]|nr:hypothetical protein SEA_ZOOMAN_297 [Microbacterium phage Zooman]
MKTSKLFAGLTLVAVAAVGLTGCSGGSEYPGGTYTGDKTDCVVNDKQAINRDGKTDYRVFTDNCGVFGVQDDIWLWQWNSADVFGSIKVGETYDFEAYGWRNGLMSTFPNIKTAHLVDTSEKSE